MRNASSSAGRSVLGLTRDGNLESTELAELPAAAAVQVARLRRGLRPIDGIPVVAEVEYRRLDTLYETKLGAHCTRQAALRGQPEQVEVRDARVADRFGDLGSDLVWLTGREEEVREGGVRSAQKPADGQAEPGLDVEGKRCHQAAVPAHDSNRQLADAGMASPPAVEPGVEQEGARSRHRPDELVPLGREQAEALERGHGLDGERVGLNGPSPSRGGGGGARAPSGRTSPGRSPGRRAGSRDAGTRGRTRACGSCRRSPMRSRRGAVPSR